MFLAIHISKTGLILQIQRRVVCKMSTYGWIGCGSLRQQLPNCWQLPSRLQLPGWRLECYQLDVSPEDAGVKLVGILEFWLLRESLLV